MTLIAFNSVTQQFPDGTVAFENLSFSTDEGSLMLITGPSGSGKTTIMRLLIGEYKPTQGEIEFEDKPLKHQYRGRLHLHRRKIGVVFQDYKLIEELNVWENIALPLSIRGEKANTIEERVTDLLKLVELTDKALMFPRQLSGGEAQRISIARALANSPKIIFADEPTGNLDTENSERVVKLLSKINQLGTTVMVATHDPLIIQQMTKAQRLDLSSRQDNQPKTSESKTQEKKKQEIVEKQEEKEESKRKNRPEEEKKKKSPKQSTPKKNRVGGFFNRIKSALIDKRRKLAAMKKSPDTNQTPPETDEINKTDANQEITESNDELA